MDRREEARGSQGAPKLAFSPSAKFQEGVPTQEVCLTERCAHLGALQGGEQAVDPDL